MGKEVKIGLAVITVLLGVFGFVLYKRLADSAAGQQPDAAASAAGDKNKAPLASPPSKLSSGPAKLSSGPIEPTMLAGEKGASPQPAGDAGYGSNSSGSSSRNSAGSRYSPSQATSNQTATVGGTAAAREDLSAFSAGAESKYPSSRNASRYGGPPSFTNQAETTATDSTAAAGGGISSDPFHGRATTGTSAAASDVTEAALLQAVDAQPAAEDATANDAAAAVQNAGSNPLRAGLRDVDASNPTTDATLRPSSRYSSGPRNYDLSGDGKTTPSAAQPAATALTSQQPASQQPPAKLDQAGANAFRPAAPSNRYGSPPPTTSATSASNVPARTSTVPARTSTTKSTAPGSQHEGETYTVRPNDNFWTVSETVYGTGAYYQALQEHNRGKNSRGDLLKTGDLLSTPSVETLSSKYPTLCPKSSHVPSARPSAALSSQRRGGRTYVVEQGDTLFDIARFELGKATRWAEIYELNKDLIGEDFNHLNPGTQLTLPGDGATDSFTRRPGGGVQR